MNEVLVFLLCFTVSTAAHSQDGSLPAKARDPEQLTQELKDQVIGKAFLETRLTASDGSTVTAGDLRGKIVFVNFWFASCLPCMAEMNGLNKLFDTLRGRKDFLFLSLTYEPEAVTAKVIRNNRIRYRVLRVSKTECAQLSGGKGYPTSFILDRDGVIRWTKVGGDIDPDNAYNDVVQGVYPEVLRMLGGKPRAASK